MKNFCVIGNPISHSLSPAIFKYLFKFFNIDANYNSVLLDNDKSLIDFIKNNIGLYNGYNITSPFKSTAFKAVDELDPFALKLGSVNCININNLKLLGYNTDHYGFINMIISNKIQLNNKKIIVLGYGGAARAVIFSLLKEYNCDIYIYGRNSNKINNLIKKVQFEYEGRTVSMYNNTITNDIVLINCLPIKIDSNNLHSLLSYLPISSINTCIDINYIESDISLEIKESCKIISGLDMLIYQALNSFDIWFNCNSLEKINYLDLKKSLL